MTAPKETLTSRPLSLRMGFLRRTRGVIRPVRGFNLTVDEAALGEEIATQNRSLTKVDFEPVGLFIAHPKIVVHAENRDALQRFKNDLINRSTSAAADTSPVLMSDAARRRPQIEEAVTQLQEVLTQVNSSPMTALHNRGYYRRDIS